MPISNFPDFSHFRDSPSFSTDFGGASAPNPPVSPKVIQLANSRRGSFARKLGKISRARKAHPGISKGPRRIRQQYHSR
jgi:hypothetical protein